jgi:hypothetical protein
MVCTRAPEPVRSTTCSGRSGAFLQGSLKAKRTLGGACRPNDASIFGQTQRVAGCWRRSLALPAFGPYLDLMRPPAEDRYGPVHHVKSIA